MSSQKLFDPQSTALVLIDLQQGIVGIPILAPRSGSEVVRHAAVLSSAFRSAGSLVVYVRVDLADMLHTPTDFPMHDPSAPPPPESASELVSDSGYQPGRDKLVTKRQVGAFIGTNLDQLLRRRGIRTIVLAGIATNLGVESTARSGADLGYELVFAEDAMTGLSQETHEFAVRNVFPMMGRVRSVADLTRELGQS